MADLAQKKASFIRRYVAAIEGFLESANGLVSLKSEWSANAYPTGATPPENNISDGDLAAVAPWLTADQLNQAVGAVESVQVAVQQNRGYLEAVRS